MEINKYTGAIEQMTEDEAIEKFGNELVNELLRINAEYASEDQWWLEYTARVAIPNHNAHLQISYSVDKDDIEEEMLEEDYDWNNYTFSVPDWDEEEEKIWKSNNA